MVAMAVASGFAVGSFATTGASTPAPAVSALTVSAGDSYTMIAGRLAPGATQAQIGTLAHALARRNGGTNSTSITNGLQADNILFYLPADIPTSSPATTAPPTTPTTAPPTTTPTTAPPTIPSTTTAAPTTTGAPTTTAPTPAPPAAGCGLAAPAFCATFDAPKSVAGTRSGDLDPMMWGVSRTISTNDFLSDWIVPTGFTQEMSTPVAGCPFGSTPGSDVQICNGRLFEAVRNVDDTKTNLSIYPKQPFDYSAGQDIVFDASMDGRSNHSAWPEIWITDQPVPATNGDAEGLQAAARNAIGFQFTGCFGDSSHTTLGLTAVTTTSNYTSRDWDFTRDDCVASPAHASTTGALNHVRIRVSPTSFAVFATEPGSRVEKQLGHGSFASTLPSNRGLVWWTDVHYNGCKFPDDQQCDHAFAIDNFGFSGPKTYRDYTYDVPDAMTPTTAPDPLGGSRPAYRLGYPIGSATTSVKTSPVGAVLRTPSTVAVVFSTASSTGAVPDVRLNGGAWVSTPSFTNRNFLNSIEVVIPAGNYVSGANTIEFRSTSGQVGVSNINLLLVNAAPVP